jgi:hypothetical protein
MEYRKIDKDTLGRTTTESVKIEDLVKRKEECLRVIDNMQREIDEIDEKLAEAKKVGIDVEPLSREDKVV